LINANPYLERYLFEKLGAYYEINPFEAGCNLNNDEESTKRYLGTYFPRSYVESYHIYQNILNQLMLNSLTANQTIEILDIGSGTGGNLFGLLTVLNERIKNATINIHSIDGNPIALNYQIKMLTDFYSYCPQNGNNIYLNHYSKNFPNKNYIIPLIDRLNFNIGFDIIHSFKFANEFYNQDSILNHGTYLEMLRVGHQYLRPNGLMLIEDMTNVVGNSDFNAIIMSNECKYFFNNYEIDLVYILPKSCALWYNICTNSSCYSKIEYTISHRGIRRDISKVTFRLFVKNPLVQQLFNLIASQGINCYQISERNYCEGSTYRCGIDFPPSNVVADAFFL